MKLSRITLLLPIFCFLFQGLLAQQTTLPLWPEGIPCENDLQTEVIDNPGIGRVIQKVHEPELAVYLPSAGEATGASVVICPGGGYSVLAWDWEGSKMAEWFAEMGIAAFVLKYRLPRWESSACKDKVAVMDANRAVRTVRSRAGDWGLDPNRVGIMGFSAGGHLASTAATHFDAGDPRADLNVERFSSRPDFAILMYPVITMDTLYAHMGSRYNLLGANPRPDRSEYYSNEAQVTAETPPTLLIHADNDEGVVPENSVRFYLALREFGVPAAMHIFPSGGHGFSFAEGMGAVSHWPEIARAWLQEMGMLTQKHRVLIVDGQNNHGNWPETTQIMREQLENSGLFTVEVATSPARGESMADFHPDFENYDVVVSNYNGDPWPQETRDAFEDYVASGGGFVPVHAANNAFPDWKAYNRMIGLGGWEGRDEKDGPYVYYDKGELKRDSSAGPGGHHGRQHAFVVETRVPDHPIMRGLPWEWLHVNDELYDQLRGPAENLSVLATAYSDPATGGTGRHEPMLMTIQYGLGRVFHTTLGHANASVRCVGFSTTFLRGVEWAATGRVSQEVPLDFPGPNKSSERSARINP